MLRALGLGDLLTGVPAMRGLARRFPAHRRLLAAPAQVAPLALHAGAAHEIVPVGELEPLPHDLTPLDLAVNLHGRGPQSHRLLLSARPGRLVAFAHDAVPETMGFPEWPEDIHEVDRWCRLLERFGIPADRGDLYLDPPAVPLPTRAPGATLLHPGAKSAARRWPWARWAAVARFEAAAGRAVLITGTRSEAALARRVASAAGLGEEVVLAGKTDLLTLAALVSAAGRVVAGDTGVAHLATALRRPSVLLFGPTAPSRWGPPRDDRDHVVLWKGRSGDPLADRPHEGLLEIQPEEVMAALRVLPDGG